MSPTAVDERESLPRALVVDDEKEVADAYALRLRGLCDIETVYDGHTALERVTDREFDVVLLDRHMPGLSGDAVLTRLTERDFAGRVIMVTAIDPGFDVIDMPFDDYLCKPLEREDVRAAVEHQCTILGYETLGEYFSVESKRRVLEAELSEETLATHTGYQELEERATHLGRRVNRLLEEPRSVLETFASIDREGR